MAKFKSILCPQKEDHKLDKRLMFVGKDALYVYCKDHSWLKITFKRGKEKISFEDSGVVLEPMGEKFHFDDEPMPIIALGKFKLKRRTREKRYANQSK